MGRALDVAAAVAALAAMYLPVVAGVWPGGWGLYAYWVAVTVAYTGYALYRLRRG